MPNEFGRKFAVGPNTIVAGIHYFHGKQTAGSDFPGEHRHLDFHFSVHFMRNTVHYGSSHKHTIPANLERSLRFSQIAYGEVVEFEYQILIGIFKPVVYGFFISIETNETVLMHLRNSAHYIVIKEIGG